MNIAYMLEIIALVLAGSGLILEAVSAYIQITDSCFFREHPEAEVMSQIGLYLAKAAAIVAIIGIALMSTPLRGGAFGGVK